MNAKTRLVLKVTGLAVGLMALAGSPAFAHDAHLSAADGAQAPAAAAPAVFLAAELRGANEVPPADPDGRAVEVIRIQNNTVSFAAAWRNISSPQAGHIHMGVAGTNGPVVVPFFGGGPLPATFRAVTGQVTVADPTLLASIVANPENFYVNLHTADFPGGAVRGQLFDAGHRDAAPTVTS